MAMTTVLISGANHGIGQGFVKRFLARPNHVVIAANRDPGSAASKALASLPKGEGSELILVKCDLVVQTDPLDAIKQLVSQGINHLDVVIANAGVVLFEANHKVSEVTIDEIQRHFPVNTFGMLLLFQATLPLLKRSKNPKFVSVGSGSGQISLNPHLNGKPYRNSAYGPSKVMNHWLTKRINDEEPDIISFPVDPGFVQTKAGNMVAQRFGLKEATTPVDDSCDGLVRIIDMATKESHGGRLWRFDGVERAW
ncbi:hypothetical protein DL765_009248 [Monosporascus sp. GIB2]|nr:hypothetical protein DL765_009248 [Monosporascus sp. GIB2]